MKRALLLAVAAALLVAGCGDDSSEETTTGAGTTSVSVYFRRDSKVWPVRREVDEPDFLNAAYQALLDGPTQAEQDIGLTTEVPREGAGELSDAARAQIVTPQPSFRTRIRLKSLEPATRGRTSRSRRPRCSSSHRSRSTKSKVLCA